MHLPESILPSDEIGACSDIVLQSTIIMIKTLIAAFALLVAFLSCPEAGVKNPVNSLSSFKEKEEHLPILNRWSGEYPIAKLDRLKAWHARSQWGYIGDEAGFSSFWNAFREGRRAPEVDFSKNIVVFVGGDGSYKQMVIVKVTLKDHVAEVVVDGSKPGPPGADTCAMAVAVIPRSGVGFVRMGKEQIAVE